MPPISRAPGEDDPAVLLERMVQILESPAVARVDQRFSETDLALEILGLLLKSAPPALADDTIKDSFTPSTLERAAEALWTTWSVRSPTTLVHLLALASTRNYPSVAQVLFDHILTAPWLAKQTINVFAALVKCSTVHQVVEAMGETERGAAGILLRLLQGLDEKSEAVIPCSKAIVAWIARVAGEHVTGEDAFWLQPLATMLRNSSRVVVRSTCTSVLVPLFQARKTRLRHLLQNGFASVALAGKPSKAELLTVLEVYRAGSTANLIAEDGSVEAAADGVKVSLPPLLLATCLAHSSPSIRCTAFSILVLSPNSTARFSAASLDLLKAFFLNSIGDGEGEHQMVTMSVAGHLLLRLRDSSAKLAVGGDLEYSGQVVAFLEWYGNHLVTLLNPASPFRVRVTALRLLDLLLQSGVDPAFRLVASVTANGFSSYRQLAPIHMPTAAHTRQWCVSVNLVTPRTTFTLLRVLLSPYTALRTLAITTLERFPAPLPGYEGIVGYNRAQTELLEPALAMINSGREASASAGAVVLSLVYRKWVLEGGLEWDLGQVGGWKTEANVSQPGSSSLSFVAALMDLADVQLDAHTSNLALAATTSSMHGTLLAIRHLLLSLPSSIAKDERRTILVRALGIVERVWQVTAPVLAASAPEDAQGTTDTEEARAIKFVEAAGDDGDDLGDASEQGTKEGGNTATSRHRIILSSSWRAMKENGELLETILRIPAGLDLESFQSTWSVEEIVHMGELYAVWMAKVRHRGTVMALHPCYARVASALLLCKEWPEVQTLPLLWLDVSTFSLPYLVLRHD